MANPVTRDPNIVTRDNTKGVAKAPTSSPEELGVANALRALLKKHENTEDADAVAGTKDAQSHSLGGRVRERNVMDAVDQAVTGVKGVRTDY